MSSAIPPITVIAWPEFMESPSLMYGLFSVQNGKLCYDASKVIVLQELTHDNRYVKLTLCNCNSSLLVQCNTIVCR